MAKEEKHVTISTGLKLAVSCEVRTRTAIELLLRGYCTDSHSNMQQIQR
jgi:hypothetical protein